MPLPESLAGVPTTAIGVALLRAHESARDDRLFDDPYAQLFVDAARGEFLAPDGPPEAVEKWETLQRLVQTMSPRAVVVRFLQDYLLASVAGGCSQVVVLGAGLDTYGYRLHWARPCRYIEVDLPEMFGFKQRVLADSALRPTGPVVEVAADLRHDWVPALLAADFDPTAATAWLDGGVLGYLSREVATSVMLSLCGLSGSGSRFACVRPGQMSEQVTTGITRVASDPRAPARPDETGFEPDPAAWLHDQGWHTTRHDFARYADSIGRPTDHDDTGTGFLVADLA